MKKYLIIGLALVIVLGVASVSMAGNAGLSGWSKDHGPWSSTIGWLSFFSKDTGNGSTVDYGVSINTTTGLFSGSAWSSNIGWVKFDAGAPSGVANGTTPSSAKLDLVTGKVTGWARACSGTVNKDCNSADRTDGWDGWIALSGTATNRGSYGVTVNTTSGNFSGFGWGSTNVGWLTFDGVTCTDCFSTTQPPTSQLTGKCLANYNDKPITSTVPITVTFTASASGGSGTYYWEGSESPSATYTIPAQTYSSSATQKISLRDELSAKDGIVIQCPTVTITGGGTPPGPVPMIGSIELRAHIFPSDAGTTTMMHSILNNNVYMGWRLSDNFAAVTNQYNCSGNVTEPTANAWDQSIWIGGGGTFSSVIDTPFGNEIDSSNNNVSPGAVSRLPANRLKTGRYVFWIDCEPNGTAPEGSESILSNKVNVVVTSSGVEEI